MSEKRDECEWSKVRAALADPQWDFRTIGGIAKVAQLDPGRVEHLIRGHRSEVRQTRSRDRKILYTLSSRPRKFREIVADIQMLASQ